MRNSETSNYHLLGMLERSNRTFGERYKTIKRKTISLYAGSTALLSSGIFLASTQEQQELSDGLAFSALIGAGVIASLEAILKTVDAVELRNIINNNQKSIHHIRDTADPDAIRKYDRLNN